MAAASLTAAVWPPVKEPSLCQPRFCFRGHGCTRQSNRQYAASVHFASPHNLESTHLAATTASHQLHGSDTDFEIRRLIEMGDITKVLESLSHIHAIGRRLSPATYLMALDLCTECKALEEGRRLHQFMSSSGMCLDGGLGVNLVFMYVNCGDLVQGRRVFDGITHKENRFLWSLFLREYVKIRDHEQVTALLRQMMELRIEVDSYAMCTVLKYAAETENIEGGEQLHAYALKTECDAYVAVSNALILMYCKCGYMEAAGKIFDRMSDRDVISWNSYISGCQANDLFHEAVHTLSNMWFSGIHIDVVTLISVLPAFAKLGTLVHGKAIHGHAIKNGYRNLKLSNSFISMYFKCGDSDSAIKVFEMMDRRDVVSWTAIIPAYSQTANSRGIIGYLHLMETEDIKPDGYLVTTALQACATCKSLDQGRYIHNYILEKNIQFSLAISNALINMYAECGCMNEARTIFDGMVERNIISWNSMIGGYSKNNLPNEAILSFREMLLHMKPDGFTMVGILLAAASLFSLDKGKEIHGYMLRNDIFSDGSIWNALLNMYTKCGALPIAEKLFDQIVLKDVISWTIMIAGYGMHGRGKEAIATFKKMRRRKIEPTETSFVAILYACSQSRLVEQAWIFFDIMRNEYEFEPKLEHYASMVDVLSRAGQLSKAYQFIKSMPIKPDSNVWGALLYGCRVHRDLDLAEEVAEQIFELEPGNATYYTLLANIYAEHEKWEAVNVLKNSMGRRFREHECSWTEMRGKSYIFVSGDRIIPNIRKIRSYLANIVRRMDVNGKETADPKKNPKFCNHTELLAVGFGCLYMSAGKPVHVVKNRRGCNNCHDIIKFISLSEGRQIILRDPNCFHHFINGQCSCKGYW